MTNEWPHSLLCSWNGFYESMLLAVTYLVNWYSGGEPCKNIERRVVVPEHVTLLDFEWMRQAYTHMKLWRLTAWDFSHIAYLAESLFGSMGSARNVQNLYDLSHRASRACLHWFEQRFVPFLGPDEASDYFQRTAKWISFEFWTDEVLKDEVTHVARHRVCSAY